MAASNEQFSRIETPPALYRRAINGPSFSVSRFAYSGSKFGLTSVLPRDDAYFVSVKLKPMATGRMWLGERLVANLQAPLYEHAICLVHMSDEPQFELLEPFDIVRFQVSRLFLRQFIDEVGAEHIDSLRCPIPTPGLIDPIVGHLASCVVPALDHPESACELFFDMITRALLTHLLQTYGKVKFPAAPTRRVGLATWQAVRVREIIDANLDGLLTVPMLANECRLSVGHFSHAFKKHFGKSPYQFLIDQRLARAKILMLTSELPLAEISLASGFSAQSHFSRRFTMAHGMPPGQWRRLNR